MSAMNTSTDKLTSLLEYVMADNRVCPLPMVWEQLWRMLPDRAEFEKREGNILRPFVLNGWTLGSDDLDKKDRLCFQIQYAAEHGVLDRVDRFIRRIPDKDWHRSA